MKVSIYLVQAFFCSDDPYTNWKKKNPIFKWLQVMSTILAILVFNWSKIINSLGTKMITGVHVHESNHDQNLYIPGIGV